MSHRWITISAVALSIALAAGCKKPGEVGSTETTGAPDEAHKTTGTPSVLSNDDKEFMTKAAQDNMLEVTLGKEIATKARSPEVKKLAEQLATDHAKSNAELKDLAARKGVTLPTELDAKHKAEVDDLAKLSGDKLSKEYVDDIVDDHAGDVKDFRKASTDLKDPDLRAWATKTLPVLEHHHEMAKGLKAKMKY
jgi:putative membrane protein